jgi:hypothetical protein
MIGDGRATLREMRAEKKESMRKFRSKPEPRGSHSDEPDDRKAATREEMRRDSFIRCAAQASNSVHCHDLSNVVITQEMADAAQKAADIWTGLAQTLNSAVAQGVTPAWIGCEGDTRPQPQAFGRENDEQHAPIPTANGAVA